MCNNSYEKRCLNYFFFLLAWAYFYIINFQSCAELFAHRRINFLRSLTRFPILKLIRIYYTGWGNILDILKIYRSLIRCSHTYKINLFASQLRLEEEIIRKCCVWIFLILKWNWLISHTIILNILMIIFNLTSILSLRLDMPQTIIPASTNARHNAAPMPTIWT